MKSLPWVLAGCVVVALTGLALTAILTTPSFYECADRVEHIDAPEGYMWYHRPIAFGRCRSYIVTEVP